jgi:hypothetical protein
MGYEILRLGVLCRLTQVVPNTDWSILMDIDKMDTRWLAQEILSLRQGIVTLRQDLFISREYIKRAKEKSWRRSLKAYRQGIS